MTNAEVIKALRWCGSEDERHEMCVDESYRCPMWNEDRITDECKAELMLAAADALEAADKRIAKLEEQNELKDGTITAMATDIGKLRAQMPKWVSVGDHLPEESGEYIVYIQMGTGVEVPDFFGSNDLSYVTSMYFKERQKLWLDEYDEAYNADLSLVDTVNDYHVTHWMPLPQKPKGEQE